MKPPLTWLLAGASGIALTLLLNALGIWWLGATVFLSNAAYDGSAVFATLLLPSLFGGLPIGFLARRQGLNVAAASFGLFCLIGFIHPFWRIPLVSPEAVHSGAIHYFLYSPLVALAFGSLGAWVASQFSTGAWTLVDPEPISPPG
ncbi:MAG: hypothetical protein ACRYFS_26050 [Janthinobacterium lividum]